MGADTLWVGAVKQSCVRCYAKAAVQRFANAFHRLFMTTFEAHRKIVVLALSIEVNAEGQVLRRLEEVDLLFEEQRVGAEIDVFLALDEAFDDFLDLRMEQWLATGNRHHWRAAFVHRFEALFWR